MHIEFKKLVLHNFMSFSDAELNFTDDGFIKVSGVNENPDDTAGSNGSGKSSLWEGIVWALTGETIRGTKHVVNIFGDDGCYVELEFYIDNKKYYIIRSKDHKIRKTNLIITVDDNDVSGKGIRDSEKILQNLLPNITSSLIGSVIILGQGLPQKFTNNSPSGRKEVLEKLSQSDFMIEDLKQKVSNRKTTLQVELRTLEDAILQASSNKNILQAQIEENTDLLNTLDKTELASTLKNLLEDLHILQGTLEEAQKQVSNLRSLRAEQTVALETLLTTESSSIQALQTDYTDTITPINNKIIAYTSEASWINKQITSLKSIKDVCPTCGQKLPNVHKTDTTDLEKQLAVVQNNLREVTNAKKTIDEEYNTKIQDIKSTNHTQKSQIQCYIAELDKQESTLQQNINQTTSRYKECSVNVHECELKLAQIDLTLEHSRKIILDNTNKLQVLDKEILYNNMQRDLTQDRINILNKFETALKRDFRGYLLSTVIEYIQRQAKQYSQFVFGSKELDFCLDGNNIDIRYMNKPYENLSGGEQQKIDLIIQFSIRDMLSTHLEFTSNVLVLDEIFDSLDNTGCTKIIDLISSLTDIKNVFVVTHRKDLSIPSDMELTVVKSPANLSRIQRR